MGIRFKLQEHPAPNYLVELPDGTTREYDLLDLQVAFAKAVAARKGQEAGFPEMVDDIKAMLGAPIVSGGVEISTGSYLEIYWDLAKHWGEYEARKNSSGGPANLLPQEPPATLPPADTTSATK
jgi:hypothetical protein